MNKYILAIVCGFSLSLLQGQNIRGKVIDAETGDIIPFAGITVNDENRGITANSEGEFVLNQSGDIHTLHVRAFGYQRKSMTIQPETENILVELEPDVEMLSDVVVLAGENPLHRIVRKAMQSLSGNNPEHLDAFSYKTYSKLLFTLMEDSLGNDFDTSWVADLKGEEGDSIMKIDSSAYEARRFMERQHLFIMESVTERQYANPRDHEEVIATRVSGLQTPLFVLLATEIQSFSFYDRFVKIMGEEFVNPIAPGAIGRYVYLPKDSVINGSDTTFIIEFYPIKGAEFKGMRGEIHITTDQWAVTRVIARRNGAAQFLVSNISFGFEIEQIYEKIEGHWFPVELLLHFKRFGEGGAIGIEPRGLGRTLITEIKINPPLKRSDVERVAVRLADDAAERGAEFWNQYRTDTLNEKELNTYHYMDSVGEAIHIEDKIKWFQALSTGRFNFDYVDLLLGEILRYNVYEGIRLGIGLETSNRLMSRFKIGGILAYGFKDRRWKYAYYGKYTLNKVREWELFAGYRFDLYETGGTRYQIDNNPFSAQTNYRYWNIPVFDESSEVYAGTKLRIWPNWIGSLSFHRSNRFNMAHYYFQEQAGGELVNGFNTASIRFETEYAPNDRYMAGSFGLRSLDKSYPRFQLVYEESLDGFFERNYPFRRFDLKIVHQFKRVYTGQTQLTFLGSWVDGNLPYSFLSGPMANGGTFIGDAKFGTRNLLAGHLNFETMPFNTFAANLYAMADVRHSFGDRLFHIGRWKPEVELLYRGTWGILDNSESHIGFPLRGIDHYYQEAGLEISLFNVSFYNIGFGFYQRFGAYYTGFWSDNAALKLSLKMRFF